MLLAAGLAALVWAVSHDAWRTAVLSAVTAGAPPAPARTAAPVPLTEGEVMDGFADWSVRGESVAFMRNGRIWVAEVRDRKVRPLTDEGPWWDAVPRWTPDGRRLAFVRYPKGPGAAQPALLLLIAAAGGDPEVLLESTGPLGYLAFSPDGRYLAFSTSEYVGVLELATGRSWPVAAGMAGDYAEGGLSWSRDGRYLAYAAGGKEAEVYVLPLAAGLGRQVTTGGGLMPHFAPDAEVLAFRRPAGKAGLYEVAWQTDAAPVLLLADTDREMHFHPAYSPDGSLLAVSHLSLQERRLVSRIWLHRRR